MQQFRIVEGRRLVLTLIFGLVSSLASSGCGASRTESPVAQASAGQAVAKSSMDYMRKHVSEKKPATKSKTRGH